MSRGIILLVGFSRNPNRISVLRRTAHVLILRQYIVLYQLY